MTGKTMNCVVVALAAVVAFGITACSSVQGTAEVTAIETPEGAIIVDTFKTTATVVAIDGSNRKVTLKTADGHKTKYQCSPDMPNFSQIQVGDQVKVVVTEAAVVYFGAGEPPSDMAGAAIAVSPDGTKPAGVIVETSRVTAEVIAVDLKKHKVTLEFSDGSTKTVKAGKKVNLAAIEPGDDITVQMAEALALSVQRP